MTSPEPLDFLPAVRRRPALPPAPRGAARATRISLAQRGTTSREERGTEQPERGPPAREGAAARGGPPGDPVWKTCNFWTPRRRLPSSAFHPTLYRAIDHGSQPLQAAHARGSLATLIMLRLNLALLLLLSPAAFAPSALGAPPPSIAPRASASLEDHVRGDTALATANLALILACLDSTPSLFSMTSLRRRKQ